MNDWFDRNATLVLVLVSVVEFAIAIACVYYYLGGW